MQQNIFIGGINSFVCSHIVEKLRNDHDNDTNPHIITGTRSISPDINGLPNGASKFIQIDDIVEFARRVYEADIVIYNVDSSPLDEIMFAISIITHAPSSNDEKEHKFILISSPFIWKSPFLTEGEEIKEIKAKELDLKKRNYEGRNFNLKSIEDRVMGLTESIYGWTGVVICPGILYGLGEESLTFLFKKAWLNEPLPILVPSSNYLPLIHISDFVQYIEKIAYNNCSQYIICTDNSRIKQIELVEAIGKQFGSQEKEELSLCCGDEKMLVMEINLIMERTEEECFECLEWKYLEGPLTHISSLSQEFMKYRGLLTTRINIVGVPSSGKTTIAQKFGQLYNLPVISTHDVVSEVLSADTELGKEIRQAVHDVRAKMIEDASIEFEKKKKKAKKDVAAEMVFDSESIVARIPNELLPKAFANRLKASDCSCRGYILEGFPKSLEDARLLYAEKEVEGTMKRPNYFPQHFIALEGIDELLMRRAKGEPYDDDEGAKALALKREERFGRRLPHYRKMEIDSNTATHYIETQNQEILKINAESNIEEISDKIKEFLTRKESPVTLINETDEFLKWRNTKLAMHSFKDEEKRKTMVYENLKAEEEMKKALEEEEEREKLAQIIEAEKELLDVRSQSLRQYLVDNLIPHLMKGLIDVCRVMPEDPIQMLIDILEKTAEEQIEKIES